MVKILCQSHFCVFFRSATYENHLSHGFLGIDVHTRFLNILDGVFLQGDIKMWKENYPSLIFAFFGLITISSFSVLQALEIKASFELIESEDDYSKTTVHDILQGSDDFI